MSSKLIVLDPDIIRLQEEGFEVEVSNGHLLVHSVPYVNSQKEVKRGIVVTNLNGNIGNLGPPSDHQVWFVGDFPCDSTGTQLHAIRHSSGCFKLWEGFEAQHRFSNKISGTNGYPDYYSKMKNYISIISNEARGIDPTATPCTFRVVTSVDEESVFRYWDTASSRANILPVSSKLKFGKIAIVGLGGTGSYVLDLVAKTPVREIHLFDGDLFLQHNAFRAPGAASVEQLSERLPKVVHFAAIYNAMRTGIVPHSEFITDENLGNLVGFGFVFICVDRGEVRKMVSDFLQRQGTPFVDVGMDLQMIPEKLSIFGTCRVTMSTPGKSDHFDRRAPLNADDENDLYRSNIQVVDMNALNAALAVIMWKQYCGFYDDRLKVHHTTFSVNAHSLTRDEMIWVGDNE